MIGFFVFFVYATQCESGPSKTVYVRGDSMSPYLKAEDPLTIYPDFYQCHPIQRGDMVILQITKEQNPIVKFVKAIPGDRFTYKEDHIYINGKLLRNSQNKPYKIQSKMLQLYSTSYPVLPSDSYLVLGDQEGGSLDASKFGLIDKKQILGKAQKK